MRFRRSGIIWECERLWTKIVFARDYHRCQACGEYGTDSCHLFGRVNWKVKFDPDLGATLCRDHHRLLDDGDIIESLEIFERITARIQDSNRKETILTLYHAGPQPPLTEKANFQEIRTRLRRQLREAEDMAAMNFDVQ